MATIAPAPDTVSTDYAAMLPYWDMVENILEGADAMRLAGKTYLPKPPNETEADYEYRRGNAKFTGVYADIVDGLAAKPFAEKCEVAPDSASDVIIALTEDIDGRGNNLHVFAANAFHSGINNAIDWILVDFTKAKPDPTGRPLTQAEESAQGLRPYWVHVPAKRMLAVYSDTIAGKEQVVHARIRENIKRRDGYSEKLLERVRIFNREPVFDTAIPDKVVAYRPATFELWEKATGGEDWHIVDEGPVSIGVIALVPFITGRRKGSSWQFIPPMKNVATLQIEHYQQETALKYIKELTAFPMLAGNGVAPQLGDDGKPRPVPVGPKSVFYAPPSGENGHHGEWVFIEPSAESMRFLADEVGNTEKQMRELGRQPLTATAGITVVVAALAAQKASSAVQAWALGLKDALEQAYRFTAMWLKDASEPVVKIYTDFAIEAGDEKDLDDLNTMRENGDLSQETYWAEKKRRNILSADFNADAERKLLMDEMPDDDTENDAVGALPPAETEDA
jgi:hypothetical protein